MYIKRILEVEIFKYLNKPEIIAIIGARQCGKTTLLKHIFAKLDKAVYIDFEDREKLELFQTDIESFIKLYVRGYDYLFIDEFQYASEGGKRLKFIYDNEKIKMLISGSSSSELSIQSFQYLVGRIFLFNLHPFTFEEYLSYKEPELFQSVYFDDKHSQPVFKKMCKSLEEFLIYGGYPRVVISEDDEEKQTVLRNIYNTYFLKEIREILGLREDYKLSKLINALALQIGGIINHNELSSLTGFKHNALMEYINILQKTFVTLTCRPFFTNKRLELVKAPKMFFLDNGFRNVVIKNFQPLADRTDSGGLRENFAASEIAKRNIDLNYWRSKSKAEVDFVLNRQGEHNIPIEIKSKISQPKITKSFSSFIEKYKPPQGYIASNDVFAHKKVKWTNVHWMPLYKIPTIL